MSQSVGGSTDVGRVGGVGRVEGPDAGQKDSARSECDKVSARAIQELIQQLMQKLGGDDESSCGGGKGGGCQKGGGPDARKPEVQLEDFNGDGKIDMEDVMLMAKPGPQPQGAQPNFAEA